MAGIFDPDWLIYHDSHGSPENEKRQRMPYHVTVFPDGTVNYRDPGNPYGSPAPHAFGMNPRSLGLAYSGPVGGMPTPEGMKALQQEYEKIQARFPGMPGMGHGEAFEEHKKNPFALARPSKDGRSFEEASWRGSVGDMSNVPASGLRPLGLLPPSGEDAPPDVGPAVAGVAPRPYASAPRHSAPSTASPPPSPRMALGGPKPMPQDENGQWVPEQEIARRRNLANQYWDTPTSGGGGWAGSLAALLGGGAHGYENAQMRQAIGGNQAMQQRVLQGAADAPDMARHLIGSGVPGLATQGVGMLAQRAEKEADRRSQFEQQKQLFEFQKKMQMDLKAQEQKQMLEQLRALGVIGGDAAPAPNAAPQAPNAAPPVAGQPPAASNPNSDFIEELIGGVESHKAPTPQQKAGIALALGEKGKAVDALIEKGADLKEHQTKDAGFAEMMLRAEAGLREVVPTDKSGKFLKYDPTSNMYKFLPDWNVTNSSEWQTYTRNAREGIAAVLRKHTGAAVTKEEWDWYFPMYYPQPGDSAEVVADKQRARISMARGLRSSSGPAFDQMFPKFNDQLRQRLEAAGANLAPPSPAQQSGAAPNAGAQAAQYAQVKRNPKTGELAGYNPQTGKWEIIPAQAAAQRQEAPAPSLGEIGAP
jgi:hypothetical protein